MVCTFFGHSDAPESIESELKSTLINISAQTVQKAIANTK